jgi:hypothetical protein
MKKGYRAEREFGIIVGGIFTLLGCWWMYRGKFLPLAHIVVVLGPVLVLLGIIFPRILVYPNKAWMLLAAALSYVSTRVILGIVFFLLITPIGFFKRRFGWDPLRRRSGMSETYWKPYSERQRDPKHYEKMF